jgi:hypothetical protein
MHTFVNQKAFSDRKKKHTLTPKLFERVVLIFESKQHKILSEKSCQSSILKYNPQSSGSRVLPPLSALRIGGQRTKDRTRKKRTKNRGQRGDKKKSDKGQRCLIILFESQKNTSKKISLWSTL